MNYLTRTDKLQRKYIGPGNMDGKCGSGWIGLKGACERAKHHGGKNEAMKASRQALADKIRKTRGMSTIDRAKKKEDGFNSVVGIAALKEQWGESLKEGKKLRRKYDEIIKLDGEITRTEKMLGGLKIAVASGSKTFKAIDGTSAMPTDRWSVDHVSKALDESRAKRDQVVKEKKLDPSVRPSRLADNLAIIGEIVKESKKSGAITGSIFKDGRMEAAYVASVRDSEPSLKLDYLASNPANFLGKGTTKGAGRQAVLELIEVSRMLGKDGSISLVPLDDAVGFYKKLGFEEYVDGLILSPENAKKLQSGSRIRSDSADEEDEFFLVSKSWRTGTDRRFPQTEGVIRTDRAPRRYIGPGNMGGKCGRGWIGLKGACKRSKDHGGEEGAKKASRQALADKIRKKKGMSPIASRDGKLPGGSWDISAAYRSGKETQSSILAKQTSPGGKKTSPMTDRATKLQRQEEKRAYVNWGKTTGDWKQKPDSTAAMDMKSGPIAVPRDLKKNELEAAKLLAKTASTDRIFRSQLEVSLGEQARRVESLPDGQEKQAAMNLRGIYSTAVAIVDTPRKPRKPSKKKDDIPDVQKELIAANADRKTIPMKVPGMVSRSSSEPRLRGRSVD